MKKILILEDSLIVSKLLASLLRSRGYEVTECSSVADAMGHLHDTDLAILDYQLPDGNGLEVAERLRSRHPGIPLFLLTARGHNVPRETARAAGIKEYLEKPVEPDTLMAAVEACFAQHCT